MKPHSVQQVYDVYVSDITLSLGSCVLFQHGEGILRIGKAHQRTRTHCWINKQRLVRPFVPHHPIYGTGSRKYGDKPYDERALRKLGLKQETKALSHPNEHCISIFRQTGTPSQDFS